MKLKNIKGLLPKEGEWGIGCEGTIEELGEKKLEIDAIKVTEAMIEWLQADGGKWEIPINQLALAIKRKCPIKVKNES